MVKKIVAQRAVTLTLAIFTVFLAGCAVKKAPELYEWQGYQKNVDIYFRGDKESLQVQTQLMEEDLQKIRAKGGAVPPGYQAHMGLLYGKQGNAELLRQKLEDEKTQFPESTSFVDFLLKNFKK